MIQTPFNYTGSKFKLLEQLLPEFDYSKQIFVDVFAGGGSVFTNLLDKYQTFYVNDIIFDLIKSMQHIINDKIDFIEHLQEFVIDKTDQDSYVKLRSEYNTIKDDKSHLRFFSLLCSCTNNMIRFSNSFNFNQTFGKRSFNSSTENKINEWVDFITKHFYLNSYNNLNFKTLPFNDLIKRVIEIEKIENTMFYFDPPYGYIKNINNTIGKKQISEAGYNAFWKQQDELNLYDVIKKIDNNGGSFAISGVLEHDGNTSWVLDKLLNDRYYIISFNHDYNKVSRNKIDKKTKEILIKNYSSK